MHPTEHRKKGDEQTIMMKTAKAATKGLAKGICLGSILAAVVLPHFEPSGAIPCPSRTAKRIGRFGFTCAAVSGINVGVELLLQKYRKKEDAINTAAGVFAAAACYFGYTRRSIPIGICLGTAFGAIPLISDTS